MSEIQDFFIDILQNTITEKEIINTTYEQVDVNNLQTYFDASSLTGIQCTSIYYNGLLPDEQYKLKIKISSNKTLNFNDNQVTGPQWFFCFHCRASSSFQDGDDFTKNIDYYYYVQGDQLQHQINNDGSHEWTFFGRDISNNSIIYPNISWCLHTANLQSEQDIKLSEFTLSHLAKETKTIIHSTTTDTVVPFTSFVNGEGTPFGSFDEKLTIKDNNQQNFNFSVYQKVNGKQNPFIPLLVNDRLLRLRQGENITNFVITNVQPTVSMENVKYTYTCQDMFSYMLSRRNLNTKFTTDDSEDYEDMEYTGIWGALDNIGPKSIDVLVNKLFDMCHITDWILDPALNVSYFPFPNNLYDDDETKLKVSIDITSTPYNILVEIAKLFNAIIQIDYTKTPYVINFINKNYIQYNGFSLKPDYNLNSFSYSTKGDNLYNIMHVSGGEDADGNLVSIVPTMPNTLSTCLLNTLQPVIIENYKGSYPIVLTYNSTTNKYEYKKVIWTTNAQGKKETSGETIVTSFDKPWTELTNNELQKLILELSTIDNNLNSSDINTYWTLLEKIPHCGSFLYDFTYWHDNNLLSDEAYNNIDKSLTIDLRNINFQIMLYMPIYLQLSGKLQQWVTAEKNYVTSIASEAAANANDSNDTKSVDYNLYNLMKTIVIDDVNYNTFKLTEFKAQVISSTDGIKNNINCIYGSILGSLMDYCLPPFDNIIGYANKKFIIEYQDVGTGSTQETSSFALLPATQIKSLDINTTSIDINPDVLQVGKTYHLSLYCTRNETEGDDSFNIYCPEIFDQDSLMMARRNQYISNIFKQLWTPEYVTTQTSLNGIDWLDEKIKLLREQQQIKQDLYDEYKQKLYALLRTTEDEKPLRSLNTKEFLDTIQHDYAIYPQFSLYKSKIDELQVFLGGEGTKTTEAGDYYTYDGYYTFYINLLEQFRETKTYQLNRQTTTDIQNLYSILYGEGALMEQRDAWWNNFYATYGWMIRETHYNDKDQLTFEGLYGAAYKQFYSMHNPKPTYSASYITTNKLLGDSNNVKVGDKIYAYQPQLFNKDSTHHFIAQCLKTWSFNPRQLYFFGMKYGDSDTHYDKTLTIDDVVVDGNYYYIYCSSREAIEDYMSIHCIKQNNIEHIITSVIPQKEDDPVQLVVTGITRTLRTNVGQLSVEENSDINFIIDRLLKNI